MLQGPFLKTEVELEESEATNPLMKATNILEKPLD